MQLIKNRNVFIEHENIDDMPENMREKYGGVMATGPIWDKVDRYQ